MRSIAHMRTHTGGAAVRLLHLHGMVRETGSPQQTHADPHGGAAVRLLHLHGTVRETGSPQQTHADPHGGAAVWLLFLQGTIHCSIKSHQTHADRRVERSACVLQHEHHNTKTHVVGIG